MAERSVNRPDGFEGAGEPAGPGPAVIALESINVVTRRGGEIRVAISPGTVGARHHIMGQVLLRAGESVAEHVHDYGEESLFVVSGTGTLRTEGSSVALRPGLVAFAPKGTAHALENSGPDDLVIVFASAPLAPSPAEGHRESPHEEHPPNGGDAVPTSPKRP